MNLTSPESEPAAADTDVDDTRTVLVVGDLHLFAKRSRGEEFWIEIPHHLDHVAACVFLGDLFDFAWARDLGMTGAVEEAIHRIRNLTGNFHDTEFHYVLGNHDYRTEFVDGLHELEDKTDNLTVHHSHLRIGKAVFLHGDVADRAYSGDPVQHHRREWAIQDLRSSIREKLYSLAVVCHLDRCAAFLFFPHRIVRKRILRYLHSHGVLENPPPTDIIFGHTHRIVDYHDGTFRFLNPGAPTGRRPFALHRIDA